MLLELQTVLDNKGHLDNQLKEESNVRQEFVFLLHCEEIPLFKYIEHVQIAEHYYTNNSLPLVLSLLSFYHIVKLNVM